MVAPAAYLDECVDRRLADGLRRRGFNAWSAHERGLLGASDEEHLAFTTAHNLVILTHDRSDFYRLHVRSQAESRPHSGIILIGFSDLPRLTVRAAMLLDWIATFPDHRSRLFQWGHLQDLLDRGPRLPGYTSADLRLARGRSG